ncbi:MAG: hemerythrin domain-containing protein [Candidatus Sulfotelmatobacter sp.]|jgi:hemerythrin-like domain-containing protein
MRTDQTRRVALRKAAGCAAAVAAASLPESLLALPVSAKENEKEPEVSATEDLMREHGVIRRALLVYFETVPKLRQNPASVDAAAPRQIAQLFRTFGEDYHERMLEEQHIFPQVRKQGAELQRYADILTAQHNRGREITGYVLAVTNSPRISTANAEPLAKVFESFVLMHENHAAREDTIVFPAWKKNFSNKQLDEISDQFEDIEHKMFGKGGFEDAEKQISSIEGAPGFVDLSQFTPSSPPAPKA